MNAILHAFKALEPKTSPKYDGFEDIESPLEKWSVRAYYRIDQHGIPNSRPDMGPDADGLPWEVSIVACSLVQRVTQDEIERPLSDFSADELYEFRETIEEILNEE